MQISSGFGSGSSSLNIDGNGYVIHQGGKLYARPLISSPLVQIDNPDGLLPTRFSIRNPGLLATFEGVNGAITTDQPIPVVGADTYVMTHILVWGASVAPVALRGGLYTMPGKTGVTIIPATESFTGLVNDTSAIWYDVDERASRYPFLYWSATTANGSALTFNVSVFGSILRQEEAF